MVKKTDISISERTTKIKRRKLPFSVKAKKFFRKLLRREGKRIETRDLVAVASLLLLLPVIFYAGITLEEVVVFIIALFFVFSALESRIPLGVGLFLLAACVGFYLVGNERMVDSTAAYAFYFFAISMLVQMRERHSVIRKS